MRALRRLAVIAITFAGAACTPPNHARDAALRDAEAAKQRGDVVTAAFAYRAACRAEPQNRELCATAQRWGMDGANLVAARAKATCEGGGSFANIDVARCLAEVAPGRDLVPQHGELLRLADNAGRAHAMRCLVEAPRDPAEAIALMRCMGEVRAQVATPAYEVQVAAAGRQAAARFLDLAALDSVRSQPGAQAALWAAAACYDKSDEVQRRATTTRREFYAVSRQALNLVVHGSGAVDPQQSPALSAICARTAELLGERAVCQTVVAGMVSPIMLDVDLRTSQPTHQVREEPRQVRYQAGVNRYENPAYRTAVDRERQTRGDWQSAEREAREREAECNQAKALAQSAPELESTARATCNTYDSAKRAADDRRRDHDSAESTLRSTDAMIEEPIYRDHAYTVRQHRWTVRWVAQLRLGDAAPSEVSDAVVYDDEEAPGFAPASIATDPLSPPGAGWFEAPVAVAVSARAAQLAEDELARRVAARRATCVGDRPVWTGDWLQCWAEATLWSGEEPSGLALLRAAAQAADRFGSGNSRPRPLPECL